MAGGGAGTEMVPVERADLVTQDMDLLAELIRELYFEHAASFRCPDPDRVDGRMRSATASGLNTACVRYGGFTYTAGLEPTNPPMAAVCLQGSGVITSAREELRVAPGQVFLLPSDRGAACADFGGDYATLQVPWAAAGSVAEAVTGAISCPALSDG